MWKKTYQIQHRRRVKDKGIIPQSQNVIQNQSNRALSGLLLAMMSGIFYSMSSAIVKELNYIDPGQLCVYRFIGIFTFSIPDLVRSRQSILLPKGMFLMLCLRSAFATTNLFLNFVSFQLIPLGESAVIIFSVPVFVTVAACVCLKEPCGYFQSAILLMTLAGIVLTAKPQDLSSATFTSDDIVGVAAAVSSLVFNTCSMVLLRLVTNIHRSVIMFHLGWLAIVETSAITAIFGEFRNVACGLDTWYILLLGLLSYIGQFLLTTAIRRAYAGPVTTGRAATEITFSFMFQTWWFNDIPDIYSILGAVLVAFSIVFIGLKTWIEIFPRESKIYKKMKWILK